MYGQEFSWNIQVLSFDGLWIDMNEPSNFVQCEGEKQNLGFDPG